MNDIEKKEQPDQTIAMQIGRSFSASDISICQQVNTENRALYEYLTLAVQKLPIDDKEEASLIQTEACQRVRAEFYKVSCGKDGMDATKIVQCIIEMVSISH